MLKLSSVAFDDTNSRLGTPNAKFVSYFLIQHKSQLDNMHVSKITVFHGDTWSKNPCLLFEVGPAHA